MPLPQIGIDFEATARPTWRPASAPTTAAMLADILDIKREFEALPEHIRTKLTAEIQRSEAVAFVLNSNRLERVGSQSYVETLEMCEEAMNSPTVQQEGTKWKETVQTLLALQCMHKLKQDAIETAKADGISLHYAHMLTPSSIQEVHSVLAEGLDATPGTYRINPAYPQGFDFYYTHPDMIEGAMLHWTDCINGIIDASSGDLDLESSFKLAALALFHTVDVHPFSDCNGRLCRIVANSMLIPHHFFPVYIQPATGPAADSDVWRDIYIGAIESCRHSEHQLPADLAALLVESCWVTWRRIRQLLTRSVRSGRIMLGSIAVGPRRNGSAKQRIAQRWSSLAHSRRTVPPAGSSQEADIDAMLAALVSAPAEAKSVSAVLPDDCVVELTL